MSLDLSTVQHHPALEEIVDVLCTRTQKVDRRFYRATVAYFFGKMAGTMRATVVTKHSGPFPVNVYALALAESGFGKGQAMTILEQEIFKGFETRFIEETFPLIAEQNLWSLATKRSLKNGSDLQEEYDKAVREMESKGALLTAFDAGSSAAIKQLREKLLMAGIGSLNMQIDEIGSNISGSVEPLNLLLELYDNGLTKQKLTKDSSQNKRGEQFDGHTPTNALLFGTPAALLDGGQTEDLFYALLETGYARRCLYGYGFSNPIDPNLTPEQLYAVLTRPTNKQTIDKWANHFIRLADPTMHNWNMDVGDDVAVELLAYRMECDKLADELPEHETVRKSELRHRHSKALKLAGAYAFIDQSTDVELDHLQAAIKLVEESGEMFSKILNREKPYVKLARFIASEKTALTHADIEQKLPFYPKSASPRNDMMMYATAWGYKNHVIIKKTFVDGIEFFQGETLEETSLDEIIVSYSNNWAYNYLAETVPFDKLHVLTQADGFHWCNHHFRNNHRLTENVIPGFNMIVLDVDGAVSLNTAHELLKDYKFLSYTTKRHTPETNRFRLILPINYRLQLDAEEYKQFMDGIMTWFPFKTDESSNQIAKKWLTHPNGSYHYNLEGKVLDVLDFIPKTSRNENHLKENKKLKSLDNLERWFASRIANGNRNDQMFKFASCLVDAGHDFTTVKNQVHSFNKKLSDPLSEHEIDHTIMVSIAKKYQQRAA